MYAGGAVANGRQQTTITRDLRGCTGANKKNGSRGSKTASQERLGQEQSRSTGKGFFIAYTETKDPEIFYSAIKKAKANNKHGAYVDLHAVDDYKNDILLMSPHGGAGVAIEANGNMVSGFKDPVSGEQAAIHSIMLNALQCGGKKLDCYDGYLPIAYARYGMVPVCKVKFDREYAPEGWNFERDGEPDVIFMVHNGDSFNKVIDNFGKYIPIDLDKIPYAEDYEHGISIQSRYIEEHSL